MSAHGAPPTRRIRVAQVCRAMHTCQEHVSLHSLHALSRGPCMIVSRDRCAVGLLDPPDVLCVHVQSTHAANPKSNNRRSAKRTLSFQQSDAAPRGILLSATEHIRVPVAGRGGTLQGTHRAFPEQCVPWAGEVRCGEHAVRSLSSVFLGRRVP